MTNDPHQLGEHGMSYHLVHAATAFGVVLLALILPLAGIAAEQPATEDLATFSEGPGTWKRRTYDNREQPVLSDLTVEPAAAAGGTPGLALSVVFPGKHEFVMPLDRSLMGWHELVVELVLPEGLPRSTMITVFTKDHDHLWRQIRRPVPDQDDRICHLVCPIAGATAAETWEPKRHQRPWHQTIPRQLIELGLSFELDTGATDPFQGTILLTRVWLRKPGTPEASDAVGRLGYTPHTPHVGQRCEFTLQLNAWYNDPFDPESVRIQATFETPSGKTETVRGFYYEDFRYNPDEPDKTRTLTPAGTPQFMVRYCPRESGRHRVVISTRVHGTETALPPIEFRAREPLPSYRGFVRIDPANERMLAWDDGTPFWAIGLNVRSPYDERYIKVAPYSTWRNEGLPLYERLFRKYEEIGIDMIEVWMSSWWLALEWINDAPGFHGVGHYNQYRAWMLDHIVELAEQHGIQVILVLNNHGKFGATPFDPEWGRNPFNVKNGGFLESCEEFFSNERAKEAFRRLADYIVARWGYSPSIMSWKLFTEIDLTGNSMTFYQEPVMAQWHKEMCAYLKDIDPYDHLITTHWMLGYYRINDAVADLPGLDLLTTDAYYTSGGTAQLLEMLRGGAAYARAKRKPLLITEFGGSPYGDSMGNLIKQAHVGIWTGFFHEAPASPMYWWFALVDEKDLYGTYRALRKYSEGIDRRGLTSALTSLDNPALMINEMRDANRLFLWGFDTAYYFNDTENLTPVEHSDVVLQPAALAPGTYTLEHWSIAAAAVEEARTISIEPNQESLRIPIPPFKRDVLIRIMPADDTE